MKKNLFTLLVFICFLNVNAQLLLKENFEYTPGTALELQPTWDWMSSQATLPIMVEAGAYSYADYPASGGNKVVIGATGEDLYRTFPRQSSGSVYVSFLVNVSAALTGGEYFIGFSANPISKTDYQGRIYVKKDASNKLAFGVTRTKNTIIGYSGFSYDMNTTYLIILKYEIVSGTANDVCSMTVNPVIANGESGATWLTTTSADNSAETVNVVGAIALRQAAATTAVKVSGLRVATSWTDLMDVNANVSGLVLNSDDGLKIDFNSSASGSSVVQSFKLSGTGLSNNVSISTSTSPKYFELSTDNISYSDNLSLTQSAGNLAETIVYIRMKSSGTTGTNLSNVYNITSTGVNLTAVKATGNIIAEAVWNGSSWTGTTSASNNAIINGNYNGAGFTCLDLTVNAGKQLSVTSGTLTVNGNMTLKSDATNGSATFIDNGGILNVGANKTFVEQYLTSGRNWYISTPVSAATSNVFTANDSNPVYYYIETIPNTWSQITNKTTSLDVKRGYIANINSDRVITFTGGGLNTGEQTIGSLSCGGATFTGYNLVGNPYPSYLSWDGANRTNVSTTIWYKSKNTGAYVLQTYNSAGGGATNGGTNLIPPMQAFWVRVTSGTGSILFDNNVRFHNDQSLSANRLKTPAENTRKTLRLEVSNGENKDEALIYADVNAQNGYDTYDSNKMFNNNVAVPEIYTVIGGEKLAINGFNDISDNQQLALGFKTSTANTFIIKALEVKNFANGTKIILIDNQKLNIEFDLTDGAEYCFTSGIANDMTRFTLLFRTPGNTTINEDVSNNKATVYVNSSNRITIIAPEKSIYSIYNTMGELVDSGKMYANQQTNNLYLPTGVYIVKVGNSSKRVIIE